MIEKDMRSLGLKDMHPMQVSALMNFVGTTLDLAAQIGKDNVLEKVEAEADELIKLFGGKGVKVVVETTPERPEPPF